MGIGFFVFVVLPVAVTILMKAWEWFQEETGSQATLGDHATRPSPASSAPSPKTVDKNELGTAPEKRNDSEPPISGSSSPKMGFTSHEYQNPNRSPYADDPIYDRYYTTWGEEGREFRWEIDHECVHGIRIQECGNCY